MNKFVCLMKDNSIKIKKNLSKIINDIKYLLIKDESDDLFIIIEPKSYMKKFKSAKVSYNNIIVNHSIYREMDSDTYISQFGGVEKELTNLQDFLNYLQSLNRIRLYNKLAYSNDCGSYELIEFTEFEINIKLSNSDDKNINMNLGTEKGQFGVAEIMHKIKYLFNPIDTIKEVYIDYTDMIWSLDNIRGNNYITGMVLPYTKSIKFFNYNDCRTIKSSVTGMYAWLTCFDEDVQEELKEFESYPEFHDIYRGMRVQDVWLHEIEYIIEYIIYIPYVYMTTSIISELNDNGKVLNKYVIKSFLQFESYPRIGQVQSSSNDMFSLDKLMKLI